MNVDKYEKIKISTIFLVVIFKKICSKIWEIISATNYNFEIHYINNNLLKLSIPNSSTIIYESIKKLINEKES